MTPLPARSVVGFASFRERWTHPRSLHYLELPFATLFFLGIALLIIGPVTTPTGWPSNHEGFSFFMRTVIYARHIAEGDLFPIWSSRDNFGFGSPQPILYHKLFYLLAGFLFSLSGSMKLSIQIAITAWMMIGAFGMWNLCKRIGCDSWVAIGSGVMLLSANYTLINWFVRGAMAEFSSAMLVPWALTAIIASLNKRRISPALGVALALIFLAHSVLAFYLGLMTATIAALLVIGKQIDVRTWDWKGSAIAPLIFLGMVGPYVYGMHRVSQGYDLTRILPPIYLPENNFKALGTYIWDPAWHWGANWGAYTVQLDGVLLLLLLLAIGLWSREHRHTNDDRATSKRAKLSAIVLATMIIESLLLQTPFAAAFYRIVPGANYIQFPWRLLAIITPATIALTLLVGSLVSERRMRWAIGGAVVCMFLFNGAYFPLRYPTIPIASVMPDMQFSAFNEYVPVSQGDFQPAALRNSLAEAARGKGCTVTTNMPLDEGLTRDYSIACSASSSIVLPIFASPMHALTITTPTSKSTVHCKSTSDYPALCAVAVTPGTSIVTVHFPTFASVFRN